MPTAKKTSGRADRPQAARTANKSPRARAVKQATAKPGKPGNIPEKPAQAEARPAAISPAAKIGQGISATSQPAAEHQEGRPNFDALAVNFGRLVEEGAKVAAAYADANRSGRVDDSVSKSVTDAARTLGGVAEYWLSDPKRTVQAQSGLAGNLIELWSRTMHRLAGEAVEPLVPADPADKRFADPQWQDNPVFDFMRQAYALTTSWASDLVQNAETVEPDTKAKAQFYLRQIAGAVSPSNFLPTNPELLRETINANGENLVRGMKMLASDLEAGKGNLRIRQADSSKFELGVNMAATPGKVVFRNELMELIQYAPTTPQVFKRPLLIVPPWINKFYILDLNPQKSFIRWAVSQGLTIFVVSWVNPDARQAEKSFDDYIREGILAAVDAIEQATGEKDIAAIGYCVGGTLLAIALAYMASVGDRRISSATFFTTQVDFSEAGDLKVFADEEQVRALEATMAEAGYLEGRQMANAFNMLRPNELIWSYIVNNYLKGKEPPAFDLLVWNSDSTRMPRANHSFYLRNCYLENNLTKGTMNILGKQLNLHDVKIPIYNLATREDHIAPAKSVFIGAQFFGGDVRYVLAGSGHIAGVVNPADSGKYQYWKGEAPAGAFEDWLAKATENAGSWWNDWIGWLAAQSPAMVPARMPGDGKLKPICDAPGEYVRVKA